MGIVEALNRVDVDLLLLLNGSVGDSIVDSFMLFMSAKWVWVPLYALVSYFVKRKFGWDKTVWLLVSAVVILIITDQGSVHFFKDVFQRLRPCHNPSLYDSLTLIQGKCGGKYGFVSSHSSNVFGLATLVFLMFRTSFQGVAVIFVWAALVSISRVYLAVHYPSDIIVGAAYGTLVAILVWFIAKKGLDL